MLLAIDIGNTTVTIGVFDGARLNAQWRLTTNPRNLPDEYGIALLNFFQYQKLSPSQIDKVALCSVVPTLTSTFDKMCRKYLDLSPLIVEASVRTGVRICIDNPRELGADRVVNAVAIHRLYQEAAIVIDFGTATTFDVISRTGDYIGGVISPGIGIACEALSSQTAMLPHIKLIQPEKIIGKNTIAAMQSGMIFGYLGLVEGIINRIHAELGYTTRVIATGGYVHVLADKTPLITDINPDLSLIGLRYIYEMNHTVSKGEES